MYVHVNMHVCVGLSDCGENLSTDFIKCPFRRLLFLISPVLFLHGLYYNLLLYLKCLHTMLCSAMLCYAMLRYLLCIIYRFLWDLFIYVSCAKKKKRSESCLFLSSFCRFFSPSTRDSLWPTIGSQ